MTTKLFMFILLAFTTIVIGLFIGAQLMTGNIIETPTFQILSNFLSFALVASSAIFSWVIYRQSVENTKNNEDINARSESFRNLQFIASNHTITEFFDNMQIFYESDRYIKRLKETQDFKFYMYENGINMDDVKENFDDYFFLTVKIPIRTVVGNAVSSIQFKNFHLERSDKVHNFIPCTPESRGLIIFNDEEQRQEFSINLIATKHNEFYNTDIVNPFTKIKIYMTMHSFLGVAVSGWTELYFTNPQKLEKGGINKYKISSSQFQISGLPTLTAEVQV